MLPVRDLAAGLFLSLALVPQELPKDISLKTGEQSFCRAPFTDLKGTEFPGVVRATADGDVTTFEVYVESATYKAKTAESAVEYATKRRATVTVNGRTIDDGDIIVFDGAVLLVSAEKPLTAEAVKFANEVFSCIASKKP